MRELKYMIIYILDVTHRMSRGAFVQRARARVFDALFVVSSAGTLRLPTSDRLERRKHRTKLLSSRHDVNVWRGRVELVRT